MPESPDLSNLGETPFLGLPREIRDIIYGYSLRASKPIIIVPEKHHFQKVYKCCKPGGESSTSSDDDNDGVCAFHSVSLTLLWCGNRIVASEAAMIFYKLNTFSFGAEDSWNPLYMFLQMIRHTNRSYIRSLTVFNRAPNLAYQYSDGARVTAGDWRSCKVVAADEYDIGLDDDSPVVRWGQPNLFVKKASNRRIVYQFDPAIKACFHLIGNTGPKLTLTLVLPPGQLPCVRFLKPTRYDYGLNTALPTAMEIYRSQFTAKPGQESRVELSWTARFPLSEWDTAEKDAKETGWQIQKLEKTIEKTGYRQKREHTAVFTARRQGLDAFLDGE